MWPEEYAGAKQGQGHMVSMMSNIQVVKQRETFWSPQKPTWGGNGFALL